MSTIRPALVKQYSNQPATTLSFLDNDDPYLRSITERERKTEKSVHFAPEEESVSDGDPSDADSLQTSKDLISWIPSEHLYEEDTFISETQIATDVKGSEEATSTTGPGYDTNTFIDLESEDETRTASEYSESEGPSWSEVFSSPSVTYRDWKDVTEIVKDIEELEESEFVTKADTTLIQDQETDHEDTDVSDSLETEWAREQFLQAQIRRLKLGAISSPRSLAVDSPRRSIDRAGSPKLKGPDSKAKAAFCKALIEKCRMSKDSSRRPETKSELHQKAAASKNHDVQFYGLNPAIVDRLRIENLNTGLEKKIQQLDEETQRSQKYIDDHQHVEEEFARRRFMTHIEGQVLRGRTEDRIHAHLIKMHPVLWFSDYVRELPKHDEDSWDILYRYKTLLEKRKMENS